MRWLALKIIVFFSVLSKKIPTTLVVICVEALLHDVRKITWQSGPFYHKNIRTVTRTFIYYCKFIHTLHIIVITCPVFG